MPALRHHFRAQRRPSPSPIGKAMSATIDEIMWTLACQECCKPSASFG